ncbi:hypothetical protein [Paenibacillus piri]|uniref:hypothetical protein n=1 Tax=Paenibacillus piri TaxID=2547395 RepID=UPI001404BD62|nr:hypothetical protein [Paenibacillus piri]
MAGKRLALEKTAVVQERFISLTIHGMNNQWQQLGAAVRFPNEFANSIRGA